MFAAIIDQLYAIAGHVEDETGLEHIPVAFIQGIFSGIIGNHNQTLLTADE